MKKLDKTEISALSEALSFTFEEAAEIADIFYAQKEDGNYRLESTDLSCVESYINEWENNWFRYNSYDELVQSEEEQGHYGLTPEQLIELDGESFFKLSSGKYIQTIY